jgi:hypothetical protein
MSNFENEFIQTAFRTWRKPHTKEEEDSVAWKVKDNALKAALIAVSESVTVEKTAHAVYVFQPGEDQWASYQCGGGPHISNGQQFSDQSRFARETMQQVS